MIDWLLNGSITESICNHTHDFIIKAFEMMDKPIFWLILLVLILMKIIFDCIYLEIRYRMEIKNERNGKK